MYLVETRRCCWQKTRPRFSFRRPQTCSYLGELRRDLLKVDDGRADEVFTHEQRVVLLRTARGVEACGKGTHISFFMPSERVVDDLVTTVYEVDVALHDFAGGRKMHFPTVGWTSTLYFDLLDLTKTDCIDTMESTSKLRPCYTIACSYSTREFSASLRKTRDKARVEFLVAESQIIRCRVSNS